MRPGLVGVTRTNGPVAMRLPNAFEVLDRQFRQHSIAPDVTVLRETRVVQER